MSLTGKWKLNHDRTGDLTKVMKAIGQSDFVIWAIGEADDETRFLHYKGQIKGKDFHALDMRGHMELKGAVKGAKNLLKYTGVGMVTNAMGINIEFDKVDYSHTLMTNGKLKDHAPDQKRLGPTRSKTYWLTKDGHSGMMVEWHLSTNVNGILYAFHYVDEDGRLHVVMSFGDVCEHKIYDRVGLNDVDRKRIATLNSKMNPKGLTIVN